MKDKLLLASILFIALYMIVPWIVTRLLGMGVFRRGHTDGQVAFTFDDGPDPNYTPRLLELLQKHQVKATFFVLGEKAEKYPALIQQIHADGHQIGIHNYTHFSNWFMWPWTVRRKQIHPTATIVEQMIGIRPAFYRPPWGIINLFDFWLRKQYQIVLWSLMVRDWRSQGGYEWIKRRLLHGITDGSVVLLHDSGETFGANRDAPKYMLMALDDVLTEVTRRGFKCVRIDEMLSAPQQSPFFALSRQKRILVRLWIAYERILLKVLQINPVDRSNPLLRLRVRPYHGNQPILLDDGTAIRKGDRIVELHLDNRQLFQLGALSSNSTQLAIQLIRGMQHLLPKVSERIQRDPAFRGVKGLYGISLMNRGPQQLGFTVVDLPRGIFAGITKWYLRLLLAVIHPSGNQRLQKKNELLVPKIIVMSSQELLARYHS